MKKNLLSVLAASALLFAATSCSEDEELLSSNNEKVSFQVEMDGTGPTSRALGDGTGADKLYYEVWDKNTNTNVYDAQVNVIDLGEGKRGATLSLDLVKGVPYDILFWAHNEAGSVFDASDLTAVTMKTTALKANMEEYDAFTAALNGYKVQSGSKTIVPLKRPFAQVNVGTTKEDWEKAENLQVVIDQSLVTVKNVNTVYNVATATASVPMDLTYTLNVLVDKNNTFKVKEKGIEKDPEYHYLGMNYMLANVESSMKDMEIELHDGEHLINTIKVTNLPIRRNYRTNVIGNLLTSDEGFDVVIDPNFENTDHVVTAWDGSVKKPNYDATNKIWTIKSASELAWIAGAVNGTLKANERSASEPMNFSDETVVLDNDIDLQNHGWIPIGHGDNSYKINFQGTFDGHGHTISNLNVTNESCAGLFGQMVKGTIKNVNVKNVTIETNHYAGAIVGWVEQGGDDVVIENCHVDGGTITAAAELIDGKYDNGDKVGGLVGFLYGGTIKGSSVKNLTITAYRDLGGIAGYAKGSTLNNNSVENTTLYVDNSQNYKNYTSREEYNANEIIGRREGTITEDGNTANDVTVFAETITVMNINELRSALTNAKASTIINFGADITGNATVSQLENANIVIDGCDRKFDGTIIIDGNARYTGAETLILRNINFNHVGEIDFIKCDQGGGNDAYAHNVTVDNCTFTGNGTDAVVAMRYRQCYNMTIKNSTGTGLHSLMQAVGCNGITIDGVTATGSEGGANLNTSVNLVVKNSTLTATADYGYGIRVGNNDNANSNLTITDCNLTADAPVLLRGLTEGETYTLALEGKNTLTNKGQYQIIVCNNEYKSGVTLEEPTGKYTITGAEGMNMFPVRILHEESGLIWNGVKTYYLSTVEDLQKAASYFVHSTKTGEGRDVNFELEANINMKNTEWTPWSVMWINFDGKGHTISNIKVTEGWRSGFFGYAGAVKINNLTLENVNVAGAQAGILAGSVEGVTTTNVKIAGENSVSYKEYSSSEYTETWGGIGAVTGVLANSTINAEIVGGAKVVLNYNDIETEATYKSYKTGYLNSNTGAVTENGEIVLNGTIQYGSVAYSVSEDGTKVIFSAVGVDAKTVPGVVKDSEVKSVVVEEGIVTIGDRTFRYMPNLESVTLPNTVTTFEEGAFQSCGITSLTVPESVTYMGKQSIGYLPNIETIDIKAKNVTIGNYIARACPNLKHVYIHSDNVTFESGSMYFTNKESGDASGILFYVKNKTIADTLYTALSTSHSYGLKIVSLDGNTVFYNTLE